MATLTRGEVMAIVRRAPAGTSPEGIMAALEAKGHTLDMRDGWVVPPDTSEVQTGATEGLRAPGPVAELPYSRIGRAVAPMLPEALGFAGGMVPGPLGVGLATAGGFTGEAMRQPLMGEEMDRGRMYGAGATQGAGAAAGLGLGSVAGLAGRGLVHVGRKVAGRYVDKAAKSMRKIAETRVQAAREATPGRVRAAGASATKARGEASAARSERRQAAGATAREVSARQAADPSLEVTIGDIAKRLAKRTGRPEGLVARDIRERLKEVLPDQTLGAIQGNKLRFTLEEAQKVKQVLGASSKPRAAYASAERGVPPKPHLDAAIEKELRGILEDRIPGIDMLNRRTSGAITRERELRGAARTAERGARLTPLRESARIARMEADLPSERTLRDLVEARMAGRVEGPSLGFGMSGVTINPPRDVAGFAGRALQHPTAQRALRVSPRVLAALYGSVDQE